MKIEPNGLNGERQETRWCSPELCGLAVSLALLWAGCGYKGKVAAEINPVGTYSLASVDGNAVPCQVTHGGHAMTVQSGSFVIGNDGTCSSKVIFLTPAGREATREVKATYTRAGATLTMKWAGAGLTTGTVAVDSFTMDNEGMIFVYHK